MFFINFLPYSFSKIIGGFAQFKYTVFPPILKGDFDKAEVGKRPSVLSTAIAQFAQFNFPSLRFIFQML